MVRGGEVGRDPDPFDAEQHERRPEDVEELDGDEGVPELQASVGGRGGGPVMADKQGLLPG